MVARLRFMEVGAVGFAVSWLEHLHRRLIGVQRFFQQAALLGTEALGLPPDACLLSSRMN